MDQSKAADTMGGTGVVQLVILSMKIGWHGINKLMFDGNYLEKSGSIIDQHIGKSPFYQLNNSYT